jgi:hypothetical protein
MRHLGTHLARRPTTRLGADWDLQRAQGPLAIMVPDAKAMSSKFFE